LPERRINEVAAFRASHSSRFDLSTGEIFPGCKMKIWDISRPLTNNLAPWPGDTPFDFRLIRNIPDGGVVNLGSIGLSVHNGTHADAVFHFEENGLTIEKASLDVYFGRAAVVDLASRFSDGRSRLIEIEDLRPHQEEIADAKRLLVRTNIWQDSTVFPQSIAVITPEVAEWLGTLGLKLLGLDLPSVDPIDARELRNHHALGRAGVSIIESLDLKAISAGIYNFIGLPLRIVGADGSPIRAILWRE
jgi:arylformamidase